MPLTDRIGVVAPSKEALCIRHEQPKSSLLIRLDQASQANYSLRVGELIQNVSGELHFMGYVHEIK